MPSEVAAAHDAAERYGSFPPERFESEQWDRYEAALQTIYRLFVSNPPHTPGVCYSLWYRDDAGEYPILVSNTGGFPLWLSRSTAIGDGLEPTSEFLSVIGVGFHEAMCMTPPLYFDPPSDPEDAGPMAEWAADSVPLSFARTVETAYDGTPREYEVWVASRVLPHITLGDVAMPELKPLAEWAGKHSEFGVPMLAGLDGGEPRVA